jgi:S1-C subfamily serine protease
MKRLTTIFGFLLIFSTSAIAQNDCCGAYLGIYSEQISKQKAELLGFKNPYGSYITRVVQGTPADVAGLQALDYIYGIGKAEMDRNNDLNDLLADHEPGESSTLLIVRKGKKKRLPVTFGSRENMQSITAVKEEAFLGVSPHGQNSKYNDQIGVKIYVVDNSTALEMGLQDGDVITAINGHTMVEWRDISIAINNLEVGQNVTLDFLRDDQPMSASGEIKSQRDTKRRPAIISEWNPKSRGYLGIYSNTVSGEKAEKLNFDNRYGSYVSRVLGNTAAAEAGLQPFDYVYGVDDYRTNEDESLTSILKRYEPGDRVTVHFIRDGKKKRTEVTLKSRDSAERSIDLDQCETPLLGVREYGGHSNQGVRVEIVRRSTAEAMGMEDRDVIVSINGYPIIDWTDISTAIDNMQIGETVQVEFLRDGNLQEVSAPIQSYCDTYTDEDRSFSITGFGFADTDANEARSEAPEEQPIRDVDVSRAIIELKDISTEEMEQMRTRFGIELASENTLQIDDLNMFPNAATSKYELTFHLPTEGETKISVYNSAGRLIYEYDLGQFTGEFQDQVDISQNGIGNYYLEILQDNKALTKKILLQTL